MEHITKNDPTVYTPDGTDSRLFFVPESNKPLILLPEEKKATELILLSDLLSALPLDSENQDEDLIVDEIFELLSQHRGSLYIDKYLRKHFGQFIYRSAAAPEKIQSIPEKVGIVVNNDGEIQKTGIFTKEGARSFELEHLLLVEPTAIKSSRGMGHIHDAEVLIAEHRDWQREYTRFYQTPFTFDIGQFLTTEEARIKWYQQNHYLLT